MSNVDEPEVPQETLTDRLAEMADNLEALLAVVVGYRTKAIEGGFSEYAAEEMSLHVHAKMLED